MKEKRVRQLAAVMFADIVGYTALMQKDEQIASKLGTRHREVFKQQHKIYQGKIIQYYGDGVVSVFKSAVEAVECAIQIQLLLQEADPVPLRIGLHIGDIVFDETEIYGDGVNVASRIESLGVAGAILLSGKLNDELKNHPGIATTSLGMVELKNVERPIEVFAITNEGIKVPLSIELKGKGEVPGQPIPAVPLLTKLHISPPGVQTLHRPELFEKLDAGLKAKLILISAPAGFGKTTLLSDWIIQQDIPASWYSIDKGDNDVATFFSYLIAAIQRIYPEFGQQALKLLHSPNQVSQQSIIQLLINELVTFHKHFLVVLDDFHLIVNGKVLGLFTYFIEHMPPTIHIVILTRADPLLPISKLRSQHQLVELRSADLSFSAHDIHFLFNRKLNLKVSISDAESLAHKTEGWIAGLQLIALSLRGREDNSAFIEAFKGDNRYIMDYLIEEVLKLQTEETKEFLLQTSLLEQLSSPLCNAVLNRQDSQSVLEMMEKNNMFIISLDGERKWYRYHHLFADLLKQRLLVKDTSVIIQLHTKASAWFEENGMFPLAIAHLLEIKNYEKAIRLLGGIAEDMWINGQHASIMKYGGLLPENVIRNNPEFCLFYAWVLINAGQIQKATPFLISAERMATQQLVDASASGEELSYQKKLVGKIAVAVAYQYSFLDKPEIILKYGQIALENLSEEDPLWYSWGWNALAKAHLASDNIDESTEALKKALAYGKRSGNIYLITTLAINLGYNEGRLGLYKISYKRSANLLEFLKENGYGNLVKTDWTYAVLFANMAAIQYFWADLEGASENIKLAYKLCIKEADITSKVLALVVYSVVLYSQGDFAGAEMKIKEMDAVLQKNKVNPFLQSMYISWKATFLITQNQLEKARDFLEMHGVWTGKTISYAEEYRYIPLALLLMAEYKLEEAFQLLSKLYEMAKAQNRIERMIEINIFFSIIYQGMGEKEKAMDSLIKSLKFASTDEILMYHLNYLDQINLLLGEAFKKGMVGKTSLPQGFLHKLKSAIEKRKNISPSPVVLTTRERETLQLMAENLSNQEIANKLFISLNTVKTRLKDLYVKLEVDSRTKAVERAKHLRLI